MSKQMIYHPKGNQLIWGIKCHFESVDHREAEKRLKMKGANRWYKSPLDFNLKPKNSEATNADRTSTDIEG